MFILERLESIRFRHESLVFRAEIFTFYALALAAEVVLTLDLLVVAGFAAIV